MRSINARTRSGSCSHVGECRSHSLGPRLPNSAISSSNAARNASTSGPVAAANRDDSPWCPVSNSAPSASEPAALSFVKVEEIGAMEKPGEEEL